MHGVDGDRAGFESVALGYISIVIVALTVLDYLLG